MLLSSLLLCALTLLQAPESTSEPATPTPPESEVPLEEITLAIQSLDAPKFEQREQASRTLLRARQRRRRSFATGAQKWICRSEVASQRGAARHPDRDHGRHVERGSRCSSQFQAAHAAATDADVGEMVEGRAYDMLEKLLAIPEAAQARNNLFARVRHDAAFIVPIIKSERLMWWFQQSLLVRPNTDCDSFVADALSANKVLETLQQQQQLNKVQVVFTQLPDDATRREVFEKLHSIGVFAKVSTEAPNLDWYVSLLDTLQDKSLRGLMFANFLKVNRYPRLNAAHIKVALSYAKGLDDRDSDLAVRQVISESLQQTSPYASKLDASVFTDLCSDLDHFHFTAFVDQLLSSSSIQAWLLQPESLRLIFPWAAKLDAESRDYFTCSFTKLYRVKPIVKRLPVESSKRYSNCGIWCG